MGIEWCQGLVHRAHTGIYRCYKVYIPSTQGQRTAVTVDFHPQSSKLPHISAAEAATQETKDLSAVLTAPNNNAPFAALGDEQLQAIQKLSSIFQKATHPNESVPPLR
eukprot:12650605-Ditylum_brightwellii.AAC.1